MIQGDIQDPENKTDTSKKMEINFDGGISRRCLLDFHWNDHSGNCVITDASSL